MKSVTSPELSVVLPVHNEAVILSESLENFAQQLDDAMAASAWHYVLVENGSNDRTPEILQDIKKIREDTEIITLEKPDYGAALQAGVLAAKGQWCLIMNVDHLWDSIFFAWAWSSRRDYDLILGSKRADPMLNQQDGYRKMLSAGLNMLLRLFFGSQVTDTHGMKLLRTELIKPVAKTCVMKRGQFDTELTLKTMKLGYPIAEAPIRYAEKRRPRNLMVKKISQNIYDLFRLYSVMSHITRVKPDRYRRFSRNDIAKSQLTRPTND